MLLTAATVAGAYSLQLDCLLYPEEESPARVSILLSGRKSGRWDEVSFEDPENLLGDDYGGKSANERSWRIGTERSGGVRLRSISRRMGHSAEVWLWQAEGGRLSGRYWAYQGMMSESFAFGSDGEITCTTVAGSTSPVGEDSRS